MKDFFAGVLVVAFGVVLAQIIIMLLGYLLTWAFFALLT